MLFFPWHDSVEDFQFWCYAYCRVIMIEWAQLSHFSSLMSNKFKQTCNSMRSEFGGYCSILLPSLLLIVEIILTAGDTRWRIRPRAAAFPDISHHGVRQLISFSVETDRTSSSACRSYENQDVFAAAVPQGHRDPLLHLSQTVVDIPLSHPSLSPSVCLLLRNHTT